MFHKYYQKAKKQGKRVAPFLLAAIMLLQTGMSNVALASDESGDILQAGGEIRLFVVDADDNEETLPGATFALRGTFAKLNKESETFESEVEIISEDGGVNISQVLKKLDDPACFIQGRPYRLTEVWAPAGYLTSGQKEIIFTVNENGTVKFTETEDFTGNETESITVKNHRILLKLQKRDAADGHVIKTATVIFKDITDPSKVEERKVPIHSETVSYGNTVGNPFLQQGHTYEIWEEEEGTPDGYVTPSSALATFEIKADGSLELISSLEDGLGRPLTEIAKEGNNVTTFTIKNERKTGTVTLMKQDGADDTALNDVVFTLYKKTNETNFETISKFRTGKTYSKGNGTQWNAQDAAAGKLTINGLEWGEYYIEETTSLPEYELDDRKYEFTIIGNQLSKDLGIIKNEYTEIGFKKVGLYNETCADAAFGAPPSNEVQILEGITFTAFRDANAQEGSKVAEAVSDANGEVVFKKLAKGTYYIKETALSQKAAAQNYKLDERIYKAVLDNNGRFTGLQTMDGQKVFNNTVVNDVNRTDLVIEKVDEKNPDRKLPGSTYGLYKRAAPTRKSSDWVQVAQATADENGILRFNGVLLNVEYQVRELAAPDGSYVSANPMFIKYELKNGVVSIQFFDGGSGTTAVDPTTGKIVWKVPQVQVEFAKKDEDGNLLAGAKLEIQDENGKGIESWTSSPEEVYTSYGKLIAGKTYKLVETEAPQGYEIAEPVEFTIPNEFVGPNENKVIRIEMIDKKTPVKPEPTNPVKPTDKENPADSAGKRTTTATTVTTAGTSPKTSDSNRIWIMAFLMLGAGIGFMAFSAFKKSKTTK